MAKYERAIEHLLANDKNVAVIKNCYYASTLYRVIHENTMSLRDLYTINVTSRSSTDAYKMDFTLKNKHIQPLSTQIQDIKKILQNKIKDITLAVDYHLMITGPNQEPKDHQDFHTDIDNEITKIYYTAIIPLNTVDSTGTQFEPDANIQSFDQYGNDEIIADRVINEYRGDNYIWWKCGTPRFS